MLSFCKNKNNFYVLSSFIIVHMIQRKYKKKKLKFSKKNIFHFQKLSKLYIITKYFNNYFQFIELTTLKLFTTIF